MRWVIRGSLENKIKAIEHLDKEVVKVVKEELESWRGF